MERISLKVFKSMATNQYNFRILGPKIRIIMEKRRLTRSNNRMIAGVCAGIADYFGWDITLVRIVYVIATFFTAFSGGIVYLILWMVMPEVKRLD